LLSSGGGSAQELALLKQGIGDAASVDARRSKCERRVSGVVSSLNVREGSQVEAWFARLLAIVNMQRAYVEAQFSPRSN
jgi:multidrug resistance efflux pump